MMEAANFSKKKKKNFEVQSFNEKNSLLGYDVIVIWQKFPHISEAV